MSLKIHVIYILMYLDSIFVSNIQYDGEKIEILYTLFRLAQKYCIYFIYRTLEMDAMISISEKIGLKYYSVRIR